MSPTQYDRDTRVHTRRRRIIFDIEDIHLPFTNVDLEWLAEQFEDVARTRFDFKIVNTHVEDAKE